MSEDDTPPAGPTKELVRIVELDYERTSKFIEGVIGTSATIRGLLVTAWIAVITLAFDTSRWTLAATSFAVVVVFGLLDAYHSWLYNQALRHAVELEGLSQKYYRALSRGEDDPIAQTDFQAGLQDHRFGIFSSLPKFKWKELRSVRPVIVFQILYPALLAVSIVAAVILAATAASASKCYTVEVQPAPTASASSGSTTGQSPVTVISPGQQLSVCQAQDH